jgi:CheY-like chemotaxis protein
MVLESLLLSRDPQVIRVVRPALEQLSVDVEICREIVAGNKILSSEKFDAVIVDCDDMQGGLEVLEGLRQTPSNKSSVMFAILNGTTDTQTAFQMGANFVLQKPVSPLNAMRCFSAAIGFMERERRRYFRHALEIPVLVLLEEDQGVKATSTNLSEGGMALRFSGEPPTSEISKLVFTLPGMATAIEATADSAWLDGSGCMGMRFKAMSNAAKQQLERWLDDQMDKLEARKQ